MGALVLRRILKTVLIRIKKDAYTYLDLAIKASPEGVDVKGYLDPSVLTTGQTSGSLSLTCVGLPFKVQALSVKHFYHKKRAKS